MTKAARPRESTGRAKFKQHPLYGRIRLIPRTVLDRKGQASVIYEYDLDFKPSLPRGAIRGDLRKQNMCFCCHVPRYFYVDEQKKCIQCGETFIFSAIEQKYWYESMRSRGAAEVVRCLSCRRRRRSEKVLRAQIASAKTDVRHDPGDGTAWLLLAASIVRYHQRTGQGNLEEAISAARRARKLMPKAAETIFWEALAGLQSGRHQKPWQMLETFVRLEPRSKREYDLLQEAREILQEAQ